MKLTQFIRDRTDVELERLAREGVGWDSYKAWRRPDDSYEDIPGCLLCNAFDLRSCEEYESVCREFLRVEKFYMRLARHHGDAPIGRMIARLALRELGRRAIEAIPDGLEPRSQSTVVAGTLS